ncbi:hypothetical protein RRG08_040016 [Elysia crispata]|uniref:Uncharacterized protein n=1 Tax=Elysia crispata TaxID=231223 RepID=A0AAE0Z809_9GAST|nr:hypothetical protein RRG08_040016 [Elysia crispata]
MRLHRPVGHEILEIEHAQRDGQKSRVISPTGGAILIRGTKQTAGQTLAWSLIGWTLLKPDLTALGSFGCLCNSKRHRPIVSKAY